MGALDERRRPHANAHLLPAAQMLARGVAAAGADQRTAQVDPRASQLQRGLARRSRVATASASSVDPALARLGQRGDPQRDADRPRRADLTRQRELVVRQLARLLEPPERQADLGGARPPGDDLRRPDAPLLLALAARQQLLQAALGGRRARARSQPRA